MSEFTYQKDDINVPLETYEWDNIWWEHTENTETPRVLYIGDSISCGTRHKATALAEGKFLFDGFGSSKGIDNPYLIPSIEMFAKQMQRLDYIIFNNGLHGFHLSDDEEYPVHYKKVLEFLKMFNVPVYVVLTTSTLDQYGDRPQRVVKRNEAAKKLAAELDLPVIDLHTVSIEKADLHYEDGVHFTDAGYEALASAILEALKK